MTDTHQNLSIGSDEPRPSSDSQLVELLVAYQFLQAQNGRVASRLSTELGIGLTDLRVLLYVGQNPNATPKDVALKVEQTSGSVTALLDRLEHSGNILRRPHSTDRRRLTLQLTASGATIVDSIMGAYKNAFSGVFTTNEIGRAVEILRALGQALA